MMNSVTTIINVITYVLIASWLCHWCLVDHDRHYHLYFRAGTYQGNRYSARHGRIQTQCVERIQRGNRHYRPAGRSDRRWCTVLLNFPINSVLHHFMGTTEVSAVLPVGNAIALVILSVVLTLIGGLIPSRGASKQDPATALRTE